MKPSLEVGAENDASYRVSKDLSAAHLRVVVLSTPAMIGLIERTCLDLVARHLDATETSVGTHVCVSHRAPAHEGDEVSIHVRLIEAEGRRLLFETSVRGPDDTLISEGTHRRAVITTQGPGG